MSALESARRARAIQRALKRIQLAPSDAIALAEFRALVPEVVCPHCGQKFDQYRINQIYCSARCRNLAGVKRHREKASEGE